MKTQYLIDTPPCTISGSLHIGHIFSYTSADIIARYKRYMGFDTYHPFCFDNNGLPTKKLGNNRGLKIENDIINFSIERGEKYKNTFNKAGIEFNEETYHTFDENTIKIAHMAFEQLRKQGDIYKKKTNQLWCPDQHTILSHSELTDSGFIEKTGKQPEIIEHDGWFINLMGHKEGILKCINEIEWYPNYMKTRCIDWLEQLQWDWSISRTRDFGIKIPNETDVFDTWFISAMSPQLAWSAKIGHATLSHPIFDLRYQGHDIIRSWAFYTISMSYLLNKSIPWKNILITGHALDGKGDKFSKSSGNSTNPEPLLNTYGAWGMRNWAMGVNIGSDIRIDEISMKMGWRIKNKFHNAKKFIELQRINGLSGNKEDYLHIWNIEKGKILDAFENMDLKLAHSLIYSFLWTIICDKWIEESKQEPITDTLEFILNDFEPIFNIVY